MSDLRKLPLTHQTMFAELTSRCMDASFDEHFAENGSFVRMEVKGRHYWYYSKYKPTSTASAATRSKIYVGPAEDAEITRRVEAFQDIKVNYAERRTMVRSLVAAGLPAPTGIVGDVAEALWKAGLFRLRGVLVGTLAFQAYGGYLGVRIPNAATMTGDADFAKFHSISAELGDEVQPAILEALRAVDPTFHPVPHRAQSAATTKFRNRLGFDVEFLTPNRGSDDHRGKPTPMPSLGDVSAEPLRFLDFLIRDPVQSVLLHKGGVPVTIPAPERFAVHKLIVSRQRKANDNGRQKARKDLQQSSLLIQALSVERRLDDLGHAWIEAWQRGSAWREALSASLNRLDATTTDLLKRSVNFAQSQAKTSGDHGLTTDTHDNSAAKSSAG